ncbi:hypothetical protein D3C84_462120 [compost metagenome]
MGQTQRPASAVVGFEHVTQTRLDGGTELEGFGDCSRHLTVHDGKRGCLMHRVHLLIVQRQVEHRAAAIDVVAQQVRKTFRIGGATGPPQQGNVFRYPQVLTIAVPGLRQHPRQCGNTPGMAEWLAHAEVTDLGDRRQSPVQGNIQLQHTIHEKCPGVG